MTVGKDCDLLGPMQPPPDVIYVHLCDCHTYADDTELSQSAPPDQFDVAQSCVQTCTSIGERPDVDGKSVSFKTSVKYLGVHLDQTLSTQQQIASSRAVFLELRRTASYSKTCFKSKHKRG